MVVSTRTGRSTTRSLITAFIVLVVIVAVGLAYASPYLALNRLKRAADARDAQTVDQYVDFPALRESLKQQVGALLTRRVTAHSEGNPLAAIGAMIGVALIGPLVDAYATPDGVAALLNGMPPRGNPGERPPVPSDPQALTNPQTAPTPGAANNGSAEPAPPPAASQTTPAQPPDTTAGYRGLNQFAVTYQHGAGNARYSAIFQREGLFSWKLAAVDLNE